MSWKSCLPKGGCLAALILFTSRALIAQQAQPDRFSKILNRLDELEKQNQELLSEIKALREELQKANAPAPPESANLEEKVAVAEQRINEQAQTKVEASQRFPISFTGMFLFDSFAAKGTSSVAFLNNYEDYTLGQPGAGATLRESIIGLDFHGPHIFGRREN